MSGELVPQLQHELKLRALPAGEYDIAEWNLILADQLPGTESLDIPRLLEKLDDWADRVRQETERLYHRFIADPADYEFSQGYFCVLVLISDLERDLGVRYNPERVRDPKFQDPHCIDPDFRDSRDLFIHGILDGPGGTCSSMPVLYTAVGRRLGYPMKLVEAPGHLFSRWDDPLGRFNGVPDRFNIDASGRGFACHPDEHYLTWPRPWTEPEKELGTYLNSLNQLQELAAFLSTRACCLEDNGRLAEAFASFHWAFQLTQDKRYYQHAARLQHTLRQQHRRAIEQFDEVDETQRLRGQRKPIVGTNTAPQPKRVGLAPQDPRDVGHGPDCQCARCIDQRVEKLSTCAGDFGHGVSCQCLACRDNRRLVESAQASMQSGFQSRMPHMPHRFR